MSETSAARETAGLEGDGDIELLNQEGAKTYFEREFPDLKHSFCRELTCVVCMDEGTAHMDIDGEGKFCMAGSGILYPAANEEERVIKVADIFIERGIKHLTSHDGCGAAEKAYRAANNLSKDDKVDKDVVSAYAKEWVRKVSEEMGRRGHGAEVSHIVSGQMLRPEGLHTARVVYYDGVGGFNPNKEVGLPMGFVSERKFLSAAYIASELNVAVEIAFSSHGLNNEFDSPEHPFIIVVFANNAAELSSLKEEVAGVLEDNEHYKAGKVKIDGMVVER
jgi:hypothetical protein